jgi:hypothetical protein
MQILRFIQFVNESNSINESGIPLYRGTDFNSERTIKRNRLLPELQDLLGQVMTGDLEEVTLIAEIPSQGKNAPQYIKDLYAEMGMRAKPTEVEPEEGDEFADRFEDEDEDMESNIFVDSEFIVKEVDMVKGVILGIPYSMKNKNVVIEIDPDNVDEVFIK